MGSTRRSILGFLAASPLGFLFRSEPATFSIDLETEVDVDARRWDGVGECTFTTEVIVDGRVDGIVTPYRGDHVLFECPAMVVHGRVLRVDTDAKPGELLKATVTGVARVERRYFRGRVGPADCKVSVNGDDSMRAQSFHVTEGVRLERADW